jgi:hypothetical protein
LCVVAAGGLRLEVIGSAGNQIPELIGRPAVLARPMRANRGAKRDGHLSPCSSPCLSSSAQRPVRGAPDAAAASYLDTPGRSSCCSANTVAFASSAQRTGVRVWINGPTTDTGLEPSPPRIAPIMARRGHVDLLEYLLPNLLLSLIGVGRGRRWRRVPCDACSPQSQSDSLQMAHCVVVDGNYPPLLTRDGFGCRMAFARRPAVAYRASAASHSEAASEVSLASMCRTVWVVQWIMAGDQSSESQEQGAS